MEVLVDLGSCRLLWLVIRIGKDGRSGYRLSGDNVVCCNGVENRCCDKVRSDMGCWESLRVMMAGDGFCV